MNTEEVISSQETERGPSDVVAEEATAAIRTFNYELCSFYSNVEKGLSVHLARKHAKYSEIEADDSYGDAAKAVDKIRRHWYICCTDGFIAEHKGVIYNGSLCKTTECECYDDE